MIEATAAQTTEETIASQPAAVRRGRLARVLGRPITLAVGWLAFVIGLGWFIAAGSVHVGAGHWLGQRLRVRVIWSRFVDYLGDHGATSLTVGLVLLTTLLTLLGSLVLLWWVIGRDNGDSEPPGAPDAS